MLAIEVAEKENQLLQIAYDAPHEKVAEALLVGQKKIYRNKRLWGY